MSSGRPNGMFAARVFGLLLLLGSAEWTAGQELQRVYMLNAGYSAHYHIFTRVDEASVVQALDQIGLTIHPCGSNFLQTHKDFAQMILYYQLYRACDSIQDPVDVPVPPLLSEIAMERLSNNTWDFEDLASKLGGLKGNLSGELGWLLGHGPEAAERLQRLRAELALRRKSNQTRLPAFNSTLSAARRQQKRAVGETNATSRNPATAFTSQLGVRPAGLPTHADEADGELQEAFHLPVDDLGVHPEMFLSAFRRSAYKHEGCAMERLEPVGKAQWMRPFTVDGYIDDSFLHTVLNTIKNESIDHYVLDIFHRPVQCFSACTATTPLAAATMVCAGNEPYTFERTSENGLWSFVNSEQIADSQAETKHAFQTGSLYVPPNKPVSKDDNFRVVVGSGQNHSNHYAYYSSHKPTTIVPMIASTYFQHTSSACELSFRHRVHGVAGAELVVTTQHLEHRALLREDEENEDDAADWVRPTLRAQFKPIGDGDEQWTKSRVSIGQTLYPTRIRIECHAAPTQRDPATQNVECNVDDITLINCDEELWKADTCSGKQAKKYLCHKYGPQKCIDYADVCDMTAECEGGEDEDNAMQKCMNVPEGARCDFEFPSETGCPQWKFFVPKAQSSSNSSVQYLQRTSHENKRLPSHGIPPRSYAYHGQNKTAGHFLFFSTYGQSPDQQPSGEVLYTYATTPSFPPTPSSVAMHESPNYRACMVRFFFCHSGTATFQLMLEAGADWSHKEVLWTPPHAEGSDPCVWQKAAASIPHQDGEYRLKLAFGKLYKQPVSVAIDDFTMTPNCFHESNELRTHFAPDRLEVKSKTLGKADGIAASDNDDRKLWFVPHTGAYRVELFGAAGGRLPAQKANNRGGVVVMNVHLRKGQSLAFVSGTAGVSPCAEENRAVQIKSASSLDRLWRVICDANATAEDVEAARREAQNLFGSGGGGAAALYVDDQLTAVAGGGGGVFPDAFALPDGGQNATENAAAAGGILHTDFDSLTNSTSDHSFALATENWSAGSGASLSPLIVANPAEFDSQRCPNCSQMFGRPAISAVRDFVGGSCPRGRFWNVAGGQGGGGASCGPGGGGGAGFLGGAAGHKRNARGGRSAVLTAHAVFASAAGVHSGDGRVLFLRCAKECPENATCEFEPPVVGQPAVEFCLCPNGKHAREYTVCGPPEGASRFTRATFWLSDLTDLKPRTVGILIYVFIFLLFLLGLIAFILFLVYRPSNRITRWLQENVKCCRTEKDVFGDMIEMNCIKKKGFFSRTSNGNRITSNPIYERLSVGDLPQIPRNSVQLMKSIGCGAFGEVYDAILCTGEVTHRVAVKTLPLDATPGAERDFQIEARMLHQLVHTNIIKFYGVAFEDLPNYIVLEYMEGGDMRNFLRDHRPRPVTPIDQRHPLMLYDLLRMALDVANGCWYMERTKFVHRDLAARNCLLSSKGPDRVAKLADFGLSRDIFRCNDHYQKNGRALMALKWMPPESFLDGMFNNKTDVWSYGVLLWEIFTMGYAPYQHRTNQEVMEMVAAGARLDVPVGTPQELYNIMLRCWSTNPEYRPTFEELVSIFSQLVADPQLAALPTPPAAYQMYLAQNTPSSTSSNTRSSHPLPDDQMTQATMSTNMSESFNSAILMPTSTDGVQLGVCEAYTGRPNPQFRDLKATGDSSQSSHDSTLHQSVDESVRAAAAYQLDDEHGGPWQPPVVARRRPNLNLELTRPLLAELPPEDSPPPPLPPKYNGYSVSNSPSSSLSTTSGTPPPTMPRTKKSPAVEAPPPPVEPGDYANDREREHQDSPVV